MMTVEKICKLIELQDSVVARLNEVLAELEFVEIQDILEDLSQPSKAKDAYENLKKALGEDEDNLKMLTCQLICAVRLYDCYKEKGISDEIYVDTMKCFTRFISECKVKTGKYAFDRGWWSYRQVSMVLFRIGTLEYELLEENGTKSIALHIPSDSKMTKENVDASIRAAKEFLEKFYPEYADCDFTCDSWLLAPKLKEVLSEDSNILSFQNRFEIKEVFPEAKDIFEWLYKTTEDAEIHSLKEDTSLQRKVKEILLKGEKVGIAFGVMKI